MWNKKQSAMTFQRVEITLIICEKATANRGGFRARRTRPALFVNKGDGGRGSDANCLQEKFHRS